MSFIADLPAPVRHLLLFVLAQAIVLVVPLLPGLDLPTPISAILAVLVSFALAWATPLIQSYGVGSSEVAA